MTTHDDNPDVKALFERLKSNLPALENLLKDNGPVTYEDPVYRFYHGSFKVYYIQEMTLVIVSALQKLSPDRELNEMFMQIVKAGTGRRFKIEDNADWANITRPMLEAFFHARYFLEMAVKYGRKFRAPPQMMPSGWAAFLYLYNLR